MAALNAWYVSVSMKCSEVEEIIAQKKDERARLDYKIQSLELGKLTLENDKKRIMCQIKDQKRKWSSSPVKAQSSVRGEDDLFGHDYDGDKIKGQKAKTSSYVKSKGDLFGGDDDDTDEILLGIKDVGEEIGFGQGGKEKFGGDADDTDEILLGIKDVGDEIGSAQGGQEIGSGENVAESDEPETKKRKTDEA